MDNGYANEADVVSVRLYVEEWVQEPRRRWVLDGVDGDGKVSEACWSFDTLEEAAGSVREFVAEWFPTLASAAPLRSVGQVLDEVAGEVLREAHAERLRIDGAALDRLSAWLSDVDGEGQWGSGADFLELAAEVIAATGRPIGDEDQVEEDGDGCPLAPDGLHFAGCGCEDQGDEDFAGSMGECSECAAPPASCRCDVLGECEECGAEVLSAFDFEAPDDVVPRGLLGQVEEDQVEDLDGGGVGVGVAGWAVRVGVEVGRRAHLGPAIGSGLVDVGEGLGPVALTFHDQTGEVWVTGKGREGLYGSGPVDVVGASSGVVVQVLTVDGGPADVAEAVVQVLGDVRRERRRSDGR